MSSLLASLAQVPSGAHAHTHTHTHRLARPRCAGGLTQLMARFNLNSGNKLFCAVDEIAEKAGTANYANLKSLADRKKIEIEGKYLDTVEVNDHRNFLFCTNYKNAFGFDGDTDDFSRKVALFGVRRDHTYCRKDERALPSPTDPHTHAHRASPRPRREL